MGQGKYNELMIAVPGVVLAVKLIICNNRKLDHKFQAYGGASISINVTCPALH